MDIREFGDRVRKLAETIAKRDRVLYNKIQKNIIENVRDNVSIEKYIHDLIVNLLDYVQRYGKDDMKDGIDALTWFLVNMRNLGRDVYYYKALITMAFLTDY